MRTVRIATFLALALSVGYLTGSLGTVPPAKADTMSCFDVMQEPITGSCSTLGGFTIRAQANVAGCDRPTSILAELFDSGNQSLGFVQLFPTAPNGNIFTGHFTCITNSMDPDHVVFFPINGTISDAFAQIIGCDTC